MLAFGTIAVAQARPLLVQESARLTNPDPGNHLRIQAVGTQIRGYVNGILVAEATDSTHARGTVGPITNRAIQP